MNIYKIIDRKAVIGNGEPIVKHEVIEGWIEIDDGVLYQCSADENDPKIEKRIPILKQHFHPEERLLTIKTVWTSCDINDKNIYDKIQIVPED